MAVSDAEIKAFVEANINNPAVIANAAAANGVSIADLVRATGYSAQDVTSYLAPYTPAAAPYYAPAPAPYVPQPVQTAAPAPTVSDAEIKQFVEANINNPQVIANAAAANGVSVTDISRATGYSTQEVTSYLAPYTPAPAPATAPLTQLAAAYSPAPEPAPAPTVSDAEIKQFVAANINNPQVIADAAAANGVSIADLVRATGYSAQQVTDYLAPAPAPAPATAPLTQLAAAYSPAPATEAQKAQFASMISSGNYNGAVAYARGLGFSDSDIADYVAAAGLKDSAGNVISRGIASDFMAGVSKSHIPITPLPPGPPPITPPVAKPPNLISLSLNPSPPTQAPASWGGGGYEYQRLMAHYGVTTASPVYGGQAAPAATATNFADLQARYLSDQAIYNQYLTDYRARIGGNQYGPAATTTLNAPTYGAHIAPVLPGPLVPGAVLPGVDAGYTWGGAGAATGNNPGDGSAATAAAAANAADANGPGGVGVGAGDSSGAGSGSGVGGGNAGSGGSAADGTGDSGPGGVGGWAEGGLVNEYGEKYSLEPQPAQAQPQPQAPTTPNLQTMYAQYVPAGPDYDAEFKTSRATVSREVETFNEMIKAAMTQKSEGPSKAEMYFRLAAAFGAPTKTGSFFESLGKAGESMAEYKKETRATSLADLARKQQLGLTMQQAKMLAAKQDMDAVRALASEEMKDRRALGIKILEQSIAEGKPQSEAGKVAKDTGLVQGTPAFADFVNKHVKNKLESGDYFKNIMANIAAGNLAATQDRVNIAKDAEKRQADAEKRQADAGNKLTPGEIKLKRETEDMLGTTEQAMSTLNEAFKLNPNTFDTSLVDLAQRKLLEAGGSKDLKLIATRTQMNLLEKAALSQLKATFPGAISNDERKVLMSVQGLEAKSIEERAVIIRGAHTVLKAVKARADKRLSDINAGSYRDTTPAPAADGGLE